MRIPLLTTLIAFLAVVAAASDFSNQAPTKVPGVYPVNVPNPILQGGDTVANATVIPSLPYDDSGNTAGYNDDYMSSCYFDNGAPDVVYSLVIPPGEERIRVSLCGSTYDTGLQILDAALNQVACNDDFCGLQSEIESVSVTAGQTYYIVVDGYSSASGAYVLEVWPYTFGCVPWCPEASNPPEGEPDLVPDYVDDHNGGCNTPPLNPFQHILGALFSSDIPEGTAVFCGESGWYLSNGSQFRDTDWFTLTKASAEVPIEITICAAYSTYIFELGPQDCANVAVVQQATAGAYDLASMTIDGPAGNVWFWVGPTVFASPDGTTMYDYVIWFTGLDPEIIATEPTTWSRVKALYE